MVAELTRRLRLIGFTCHGRRDGVLFEVGAAAWVYTGRRGPRLSAALHLGLFTVALAYELGRLRGDAT